MAKALPAPPRTFQDLIFALQKYWSDQGCILLQPYDMEVGAGTFHSATFLRSIGPEPLGNEFDAGMLAASCAGKKTSLKAALLDQRVVAGLGNIYVCEALFRARLSPKRQAATIADRYRKPNGRAIALVEAIKAVLHDAIKAGGSSLRYHRRADGSLGDFQHNFLVYDREGAPCPGCKGKIKRIVQTGRSTFYCPSCQK